MARSSGLTHCNRQRVLAWLLIAALLLSLSACTQPRAAQPEPAQPAIPEATATLPRVAIPTLGPAAIVAESPSRVGGSLASVSLMKISLRNG